MFEKVNPAHPDKIADRIAGAIVDLAYAETENPKIAVEVMIGHGACHIIAESSVEVDKVKVCQAVHRITKSNDIVVNFRCEKQDIHLANNQSAEIRCGDNGIFKGVPITPEQHELSNVARAIYESFGTDGKYIADGEKIIICQSHAKENEIEVPPIYTKVVINPLGYWTGGPDVDTGATNRKLGSDMADSVTGGGLHGKDLSKADVSVNIYAFMKAQETGNTVALCCAIGDNTIDGKSYSEIVEIARAYIQSVGGFEKFAEWGLV